MEQSYKAGTLSVSQFFSFRDFFSGPVELKVSLAIAAAMVLLVIAMARGKRHRDWEGTLVGTTGLLALALLLLARARFLGLPEPMDISRTTMFFGVSLAVIFGFPFSEPETFPAGIMHRLLPEKVLSRWGSIVRYVPPLLLLVMIVTSPIKPPRGDTSEYDQAVDNYYTIRNSYPPFDWTIVSPTEQYSAALGRGWHYDIVEFLTKYPPEKASDPAFDPAVPTTYIFIYVERVVFKLDQPPGADDASKPIPQEGGWASYYRNPGNRAIIEAKAQLWCDEYGRTHTNMAIQYEDPVFRVYKITHVPKYER